MLVLCGVLLVREALTGGYRDMEQPSGAATRPLGRLRLGLGGVLVNAALITTIGFILSCALCFVLAVRGFKRPRAAGSAARLAASMRRSASPSPRRCTGCSRSCWHQPARPDRTGWLVTRRRA